MQVEQVGMSDNRWFLTVIKEFLIGMVTDYNTTGFVPNELLIGWEPLLTTEQGKLLNNSTAEQQATKLQNNRILAIQALNHTAHKDAPTNSW